MKIRPMGAELFHADGRTDVMTLTVAFRNFANAPKNASFSQILFFGGIGKLAVHLFIFELIVKFTYCAASNLRIVCGQKGERDVEKSCLAYFKLY